MLWGVLSNDTNDPNACALARYRLKCPRSPTDICKSSTCLLRAPCGYAGAPGHSCSIPLGGPGFPGGTNWLVHVVQRSGNTADSSERKRYETPRVDVMVRACGGVRMFGATSARRRRGGGFLIALACLACHLISSWRARVSFDQFTGTPQS
jgi:hypothetical protein